MPATIVVLSIGSRASDSVTVSTVTTTTVTGFTNAWSVVLSATVPSTTKIGDKLTTGANSYLIVNISGSTLTVIGDASAAFTSTTTPATGAATTARTYSAISGWASGAPSSLLTQNSSNGWVWKGELYKEGAGANNEWTVSSKTTIYGASHVTDSTRYMWLAAVSGSSFSDNASKLTNALRYNPSNGVAIRMNGTDKIFEFANTINFRLTGLQIKGNTGVAIFGFGNESITVENCIVCSDTTGFLTQVGVLRAINSVFYNTGSVVDFPTTARQYLYNSTFYSTSTSAPLLSTTNGDANVYCCAFFGGNAVASASNYFVGSNNATNQSSVGFGTSNQVSLTTSSQFESVTAGSEDFRVKTGAALINNGIRQQTYTNDLDIVGSARSLTTPTIGAWEYPTITYTYSRPSSDVTTQWTPSTPGAAHYTMINETTYNDANYIYATAVAQTDEVGLQAMTAPQAGTSVLVNYRVQGITGGGSVTVSLYSGATLVKTDTTRTADNTSPPYYTMTVTSAEWGAVSVNWSDMRLRFVSA